MAKVLLENGADINATSDRVCKIVLRMFPSASNRLRVSFVLEQVGDTALHMACAAGDIELVQLLLDHGATIDKCNSVNALSFLIFDCCRNSGLHAVLFALRIVYTECSRMFVAV